MLIEGACLLRPDQTGPGLPHRTGATHDQYSRLITMQWSCATIRRPLLVLILCLAPDHAGQDDPEHEKPHKGTCRQYCFRWHVTTSFACVWLSSLQPQSSVCMAFQHRSALTRLSAL